MTAPLDTAVIRARAEAASNLKQAWFSFEDNSIAVVWNCECPTEADMQAAETMMEHARTDIPALCDEVDELRATLLNERGEGTGPGEGWTPDGPNCWRLGIDAYCARTQNGEWAWRLVGGSVKWGVDCGGSPTAREAMKAANLARVLK